MSESEQPPTDAEPKIIVDDDWKEQVQREKEAASAAVEPVDASERADVADEPGRAEDSGGMEGSGVETGGGASAADETAGQLPPASLEFHVSMLFTQCLAALGQMPGPDGQPGEVNKPMAKHLIDTVEILEQKTAGNVSDDEKKMFAQALHAMRMAYVGG